MPRAIKSSEPLVLQPPKLPNSLKPFFWDVRFEQLDGRRDGDFVAARLLESGSWQISSGFAEWRETTLCNNSCDSIVDEACRAGSFGFGRFVGDCRSG